MAKVLLGTEKGTGKEVCLSSEARRLGSYMVGLQGMGKTNLLLQIALQDIENGDGLCVISPHAELIEDLLLRIPDNRLDDVIVFDPASDYPVGMNIFEWDEETPLFKLVDLISDQVVTDIFKQLWLDVSWGPRLEEVLNMSAQTLFWAQTLPPKKRPTMREFLLLIDEEKHHPYRKFLLSHIRETHTSSILDAVFSFWKKFENSSDRERREAAESTRNKVRSFASNNYLSHIFGQSKTAINLDEVMAESKILLADLSVSNLGTGNVGLLGSLLVGRLFLSAIARLNRGQEAQPKRFHIIADEFRYFAMSSFDRLQDEARKFNVDVLLAHQRRGQLTDTMLDATKTARNWIVLNVNPDDAEELAKGFDSTPKEANNSTRQQDFIITTSPWDMLLNQGHENSAVMDLVHTFTTSYSYMYFYLSEELIEQFFTFADFEGQGLDKKKRDNLEALLQGKADVKVYAIVTTNGEYLSKLMNRYLYLRMKGELSLANETLIQILYQTVGKYSYARRNELVQEIERSIPEMKPFDEYNDFMQRIIPIIYEKLPEKFGFWAKYTEVVVIDGLANYPVFHMRFALRWRLMELGDLLEQEPLYMRGGVPIEPEGTQRTYSDVTNEWQNRFAHLPQFEAWVKVQEERSISEYHIETQEVDPPIRSHEEAQAIRQKSGETYGLSRDEIEKQIKDRIDIDDDQLAEYQPLK